ncbi:MAG: metalloregulator ArsR/SmtB family transcription factor [Succinivibrionaceae bacterium]|nr:metalloregulator ArsR/SmtB family transcription factor [Succinivibrionaceae bacterium]
MDNECPKISETQTADLVVLDSVMEAGALADFFKAVGDQTRIRILFLLLAGTEKCVCDIARALEMTVSAVSHQLAILKRCKLVVGRRDGMHILYRLSDDHVSMVLKVAVEHIREKE